MWCGVWCQGGRGSETHENDKGVLEHFRRGSYTKKGHFLRTYEGFEDFTPSFETKGGFHCLKRFGN